MSDLSASESITLTVEARAHGWRVDHYLTRLYPNYSRAAFQKAISQGTVLLNGLPVKSGRRLRVNDTIQLLLPKTADESTLPAEDIPLEIIYEDDYLVVINKASDMIVHPGKGNYTGTMAGALQFHFDKLSDAAGSLRPGIVHRLDRNTTGVIVVAGGQGQGSGLHQLSNPIDVAPLAGDAFLVADVGNHRQGSAL